MIKQKGFWGINESTGLSKAEVKGEKKKQIQYILN